MYALACANLRAGQSAVTAVLRRVARLNREPTHDEPPRGRHVLNRVRVRVAEASLSVGAVGVGDCTDGKLKEICS